jgi:urease accessory protein
MASEWRIWQLIDSAFPSGGFAHSGGLEAAWSHRLVHGESDLEEFLRASMNQVGQGQLPFVHAARKNADRFAEFDRRLDVSTSNHIANAASRAQGRALLRCAAEAFSSRSLDELQLRVDDEDMACHLPVCFGAISADLDIDPRRACRLFLFSAVRALISSAVRLGITGPLRGQVILRRSERFAEDVLLRCGGLAVGEAAQTSPLIEVVQARHDRLYSRLFRS